jgi:catechol 2,3-dioxygenase-like lactoylglutathione lyase family enzyme
MIDPEALKQLGRPRGMPFRIGKIGHVVLNVRDLARSVRFYTEVLGFEVSDIYPDEMVPGGMAFLRCNPDHHGIALIKGRGTFHHHAWQTQSVADLAKLGDRLHRQGRELIWGPVRHGAGHNIAAYYV